MIRYLNWNRLSIGLLLGMLLLAIPLSARNIHSKKRDVLVIRPRGVRVTVLGPRLYQPYRPLGWDRGRKGGWGVCTVPPGQAKKIGCNPAWFSVVPVRQRPRPVIVIPIP